MKILKSFLFFTFSQCLDKFDKEIILPLQGSDLALKKVLAAPIPLFINNTMGANLRTKIAGAYSFTLAKSIGALLQTTVKNTYFLFPSPAL
jgi:hypothetical protein